MDHSKGGGTKYKENCSSGHIFSCVRASIPQAASTVLYIVQCRVKTSNYELFSSLFQIIESLDHVGSQVGIYLWRASPASCNDDSTRALK